MQLSYGQADPVAHSQAMPKTQKFEPNEFKSADCQNQIILYRNRNQEERSSLSTDRFAQSLASHTPACPKGQPRAGAIASPRTHGGTLRR